MIGGFWQLMITVWLGVHPFTSTSPKLYLYEDCQKAGDALMERAPKDNHGPRMRLECVPTDKREA